jgi:hypothetical protein
MVELNVFTGHRTGADGVRARAGLGARCSASAFRRPSVAPWPSATSSVLTSRPGVFAFGDLWSGSTKMIGPAVDACGMAVRFFGEQRRASTLGRTAARGRSADIRTFTGCGDGCRT